MAEFCTCGSLMIDGSCTNKNCANKVVKASSRKSASTRKKTTQSIGTEKKPRASTRKTSKCITYNLNDIQSEENVN